MLYRDSDEDLEKRYLRSFGTYLAPLLPLIFFPWVFWEESFLDLDSSLEPIFDGNEDIHEAFIRGDYNVDL